MLFMAEMEVRLPWDMTTEQVEELKLREQVYSEALQRDGRLPHHWRIAGRYANVSVLDVASVDELHDLLSALPLFPYLDIRVTPPARRPNALFGDEPVASYGSSPRPQQERRDRCLIALTS
jgi:muconolactone D-isomerase